MHHMPFTQQLLYHIPGVLLCIIILFVTVAFSVVGLLTVRRFISHEMLKAHNDVAGFMFATLGVVYAVLLAFTVIIVWQNYEDTTSYVTAEVDSMVILYRSADFLPEPQRTNMRTLLKDYAKVTMDKEWKTMSRGQMCPEMEQIVRDIWGIYLHFSPRTETQKTFYAESVSALSQLSKTRGERLLQSETGLPFLLWIVLILGGIITIAFTFFFGTENLQAQLIMTALLAAIIALLLFTVLSLDFPFTGDIKISTAPFEYFLKKF
jgi:hypothetical protein